MSNKTHYQHISEETEKAKEILSCVKSIENDMVQIYLDDSMKTVYSVKKEKMEKFLDKIKSAGAKIKRIL